MRAPLAAITGASGFVGSHVAERLAAQGWRLRLLVHRSSLPPALRALAPELIPGDLGDPLALDHLVQNADAVIHTAGLTQARRDREFFQANTAGSGNLATAVRQQAPRARLILISSLAAREPQLSAYAASKRAGEDAALATGVAPLILRPAAIYGPGDRETLRLFRAARLPFFAIPATGGRLSVVHVADVAEAVGAVAADRSLRGTFEVTDDHPAGYTWEELAAALAVAVDATPRVIPVPRAILRATAPLLHLCRLGGATTMLSPGKLREALHDDWASSADAQLPAAAWKPRIGLRPGLAATAQWYRENGWMRPAAGTHQNPCPQ